MVDDPYTMEVRLCDDEGLVSDTPVEPGSPGTAFDPDLTYLKLHNNMRSRNLNPDTRKPTQKGGWQCTGHAHLGGEHIRCVNPIHTRAAEPLPLVVVGVTGGAPLTALPSEDAQSLRSAISYAISLVDYAAPLRSGGGPTDLASGAANCRRWLLWLKDTLHASGSVPTGGTQDA